MILIGCTTTSIIPHDYAGPTATIYDGYNPNMPDQFFFVKTINSTQVQNIWSVTRVEYYGMGTYYQPIETSREVPTTTIEVEIEASRYVPTDGQILFTGTKPTTQTIIFTPKADEQYFVKGSLQNNRFRVWLEDSSGQQINN